VLAPKVGVSAAPKTVAVLEKAAVELVAFAAVTLQRIGLEYPKLKKLEGGVYVDSVLVPGALIKTVFVGGLSDDCHRY
jgi:hypothetical protein